ncbi:MAG: ATP-binding protein [Candidatus Wallbacteria bacterium]|nr:ATP-binding protein [Candidatus Wallbacteria bacterium]
MEKSDCLFFSYPKKTEAVPLLREDLRRELAIWELSQKTVNDCCFILIELFTNFIRHSESPDDSLYKIEIRKEKELCFEISYQDRSFHFPEVVKPELEDFPTNGFGLYMVHRMAHDIQYQYRERDASVSLRLALDTGR